MRLSYKLSLGVGVALALALGVDSVIAVERSVREYETDLLKDTGQQAHTLAVSVSKLWTSFGDGGAIEVLDAANSAARGVRAHWVTLRTLLNSTLELTQDEYLRLRSGLPVARLVGAPERAAVAFSPVVIDRQVSGVVEVSMPAARRSALILGHAERTLTTAAALLLISWLWASLIGVRWVGRPVQRLAAKALRIGKGDFDGPLRLDTGDEFELLADTLNQACTELAASRAAIERETQARIDAIDQVRRADRLIAVGRIAAGVAHELGTPIQVVSERAKMARQGEVEPEDLPRTLDIIIEQTARIAATIRQVLDLARQHPPNRSPVNLRDLIESTRELLSPLAAKKSIEIRVDTPASAVASIDANQIRQVLVNLVMNGVQAMQRPGSIWIRVHSASLPSKPNGFAQTSAERAWAIAVTDQGAGIAEENLDHIFDPFFTTKPVGEGTGLGLSIVHGIVQEHGGSIEVNSKLGVGSTFTVLLPMEGGSEAALTEPSRPRVEKHAQTPG